MGRGIHIGILLAAAACLGALDARPSGSVGPGLGRVAAQGAYTLGKALLFRQLVCRKCPIPRRGFNRDRARQLKSSLDAAFAGPKPGNQDDEHIRVLFSDTPEESAANVAAVRTYLARRYRF